MQCSDDLCNHQWLRESFASGDDDAWGICIRILLSTCYSQLSTSKKCYAILLSLWDCYVGQQCSLQREKEPLFWRHSYAGGTVLESEIIHSHSVLPLSCIHPLLLPWCSTNDFLPSQLLFWYCCSRYYTASVAWKDWDCSL